MLEIWVKASEKKALMTFFWLPSMFKTFNLALKVFSLALWAYSLAMKASNLALKESSLALKSSSTALKAYSLALETLNQALDMEPGQRYWARFHRVSETSKQAPEMSS